MKITVSWNELLLEVGKLDPLALWRVGDRLNGELLTPFTTVVMYRPARYFSMYCWIFYAISKQTIIEPKLFWKKFFEVESIFLCAIQLHKSHCYDNFSGQIGSDHAKKLIYHAQVNGDIKPEKLSNGWEVNYKGSMFHFNLLEVDFGTPINVKLTEKGLALAKAYQKSIEATDYFQNKYDTKSLVPLSVVSSLSGHSCPCLAFSDLNVDISNERQIIIKSMLVKDAPGNNLLRDMVHSSIYLILNCMIELNSVGLQFSKAAWHSILSNESYQDGLEIKKYTPPSNYAEVFKAWQMYNFELIFVFALESGLSGFLELLRDEGNVSEHDLLLASEMILLSGENEINGNTIISVFDFNAPLQNTIAKIKALDLVTLYHLETFLLDRIKNTPGPLKLFYSFLLYLYVQVKYFEKQESKTYEHACAFYRRLAMKDGLELSLPHALAEISKDSVNTPSYFFREIFLKKWIVQRQLSTRINRDKNVAWFSWNDERKTYNFEAPYAAGLYRASRLSILMTYLQNLKIVEQKNGSWIPTSAASVLLS